MRILAGILALLTVLVAVFFGYCYMGAHMRVEMAVASAIPAADAAEAFADLRVQVNEGSFYGETYREADLSDADGYEFLTITVRMANPGLFPMEWIRLQVRPDVADVLQMANDRTPSLASGSRGDFSTTLLKLAGGDTRREVTVTYYVLGHPFSVVYDMAAQ